MNNSLFHLASSSPRRRELLLALGLDFTAAGVDLDETPLADEPVEDMVLRLARAKAEAAERVRGAGVPILAADTAVELCGQVLGKPGSMDDALQMLAALSGQTHRVLTAVAVLWNGSIESELVSSEVTFREIGPAEARAYWNSGEPEGKAGAYAVQGLGGIFVQHIKGSYSSIVGLPVFETIALLANVGVNTLPVCNQSAME